MPYPVDFYHDVAKGPSLLKSSTVEKFYTPLESTGLIPCTLKQYNTAGRIAVAYPKGTIFGCYKYFVVGGDAPPTCTRLVHDQLAALGYPVSQTFMPGKLIEEFKERYNICT